VFTDKQVNRPADAAPDAAAAAGAGLLLGWYQVGTY
jgi:hypothetical protein